MPAQDHNGGPLWFTGHRGDMATLEAHLWSRHLQNLLNLQNTSSLRFHYSCHCYYVIFLTRWSRLREHYCFRADSPVKLCLQWGLQLLLLSTQSRSRGFTPPCFLAMCTMCSREKGLSFSCGILPRQPLERGPWWPRAGVVAGKRAAFCSPHPTALAIACCTAPPVETSPLWLTIMGSGRIDGRQERGALENLPELQVTDQGLWHHSPVISAAPGSGPVTARAACRERFSGHHHHWQTGNGASTAQVDSRTTVFHEIRAICKSESCT